MVQKDDYYPFGLTFNSYQRPSSTKQKYLFNGKERDAVSGWDDFGARMYLPDIGRWGVVDNATELYFATSPYTYALNQPTNAIDPDGNIVIFINGLGGGGASYWRQYQKVLVTDRAAAQWMDPGRYHYESREIAAFDKSVMRQLGDYNAMYVDGSPGSLTSNISPFYRRARGAQDGKQMAAQIIESLARDPQGNITELIKIVTHSMGGVYAKGFVSAIKDYIRKSEDPQIRKALISLVADFDPFQAGSNYGEADPDIHTQQFINAGWWDLANAGWLANQEEGGLGGQNITKNENKSSHFIMTFTRNIEDLEEGTYEWDNRKQQWICTSCN